MILVRDECDRLEAQLEVSPNNFPGWLELARTRNSARRSQEALRAADNALTLQPSSLDALYEKAVAQLELGFACEAAGAFASILAIQPLHPNVLVSLGSAYYQLRRLEEAGLIWEQAVRVASSPVGILEDLAICYQRLGNFDKVAETWERVITLDASHPQALHHLAALGKLPPVDRASEEYIVKLFNEFAGEFEATLGSLNYDGPRLLAEMVTKNTLNQPAGWRILDLGCGTGLCATHLRPWAERLEGVDLSPGMLDQAKERNLYDELHCEEITRFCERHLAAFDLIVAADTINYFGKLERVIENIAGCLRVGGRCAFFVERMEGECKDGFRLERHGRFSHRSSYVERCVAGANLRIIARGDTSVRSEAGRPVAAIVFLVER
jgi:predicted TPR repeat methyltransferase